MRRRQLVELSRPDTRLLSRHMPIAPDAHAIAVMLLTGLALVLFAQERLRIETASLFVFIVLVVGLQLFPYAGTLQVRDLFSGFGHEALVAVCALMILGKGLETTGALEPVARLLARLWRQAPTLSLFATLLITAALSAFVNNTPIVVMLLPVLVGVALSAQQSPSTILMPFGLATVIGGAITTIGTSTNLLVVSVAHDLGVRPFGIFDFALPMALVGIGGIAFLSIVGPRLLPTRRAPLGDESMRLFSAVLHVEEDSKIAGKTLADARELMQGDLRLLDVQRGNVMLARLPTMTFTPGDRLYVLDTPKRLKQLESVLGVSLHTLEVDERADKTVQAGTETDEMEKQRLVEIVITQESTLNNSTISRERFADQYGLYVLAIHRGTLQHEVRRDALADVELKPGDVLLAQGTAGHISQLKAVPTGLLVLDSIVDLPDPKRAPLALGIMAGVVTLAAAGLLPIAVSAVLGVGVMLATRCLSWTEAVRALSVQVVMIVVTSLALGTALIATGGAEFIAGTFIALSVGFSPTMILTGLMLLMALLTNILSNTAAGIIGTPIAVSIAAQLGLDPVPFVVAA